MKSKKMNMRLFSVAILIIGATWIFASAPSEGSTTDGKIPAPQVGFLAPEFTLKTINGESIDMSDFRGQAVLINLWATWCPPCRAEMPDMQQAYERYNEQGFTILAINATNQDSIPAVEAFISEHGLTFPILLDTQGDVSKLYQLRSLPTSFFVDPDGIIQEVIIGGPMSEALLFTRIENLLSEMR